MMPPIVAALAAFLLLSLIAPDASARSARGPGARVFAGATFAHPGRWQRSFVQRLGARGGRRVGWRHRRFIPSFGLPVLTSAFATSGFVGGFTPKDIEVQTVPAVAGIRAAPAGTPTIYVVEPGRRGASRRVKTAGRHEAVTARGRRDGVVVSAGDLPAQGGPLIITLR